MSDGVEELRLVDEAIDDLVIVSLPLKGAKHHVPDDQDSSIVFIQAIPIGTCQIISQLKIRAYALLTSINFNLIPLLVHFPINKIHRRPYMCTRFFSGGGG
jgi:hypothetical protein